MEANPYKAPVGRAESRSEKAPLGRQVAFAIFAIVAAVFGASGALAGVVSLWALFVGITGADTRGWDLAPYDLCLLGLFHATLGLGISAIAAAIARRFRG
jgi:hypothetical protein